MYVLNSNKAEEFISDEEILSAISRANRTDSSEIDRILSKAESCAGLEPWEATALMVCREPAIVRRICEIAGRIKERIYGNRIVIFAPLYLSNYCVNGCTYCPYHFSNENITRKKLDLDQIERETIALQDMGHKRLALEMGEDDRINSIDYLISAIERIYSIKHKNGSIRRVNVNIAATSVENYARLHRAGIGTYILFQETYHKQTYERLHPTGPKHNYAYHTEAHDRAMEGGIDDVGLGVLFGLYDPLYDLTAMLYHVRHLEARFGIGSHTISVPRIRPADGVDVQKFEHAVDDDTFLRIVTVLRIAVPYTGLIVSTRESAEVRARALKLGVSQLSGASKTTVGGYSVDCADDDGEDSAQFEISDNRTLDEMVGWLLNNGYVPSFCTACYREGRTGDRFMRLAKSGQIVNVCAPNSLLTLSEYLEDYASEGTKKIGEVLVQSELRKIPSRKVQIRAADYLTEISFGMRDFRF